MKLYRFDGVDAALELLPIAARRALDHAGRKLSLSGYRSLGRTAREELVELGSQDTVDANAVDQVIGAAEPSAEQMAPVYDPDATAVPEGVIAAFGAERPIPIPVWLALTPLDRYALAKVARGDNVERRQGAYQEIVGQSASSSHVAPGGGVRMVSVGRKEPSLRRAQAKSAVKMNDSAFERVVRADAPKGDVFGTARVAAIMAAKRTSEIIPLCHPLTLTRIDVELELDSVARAVNIQVTVEAFDRTGVEMEALTAASAAALTIYDMLKAFDRGMQIGPTLLEQKSGGRSGDYQR